MFRISSDSTDPLDGPGSLTETYLAALRGGLVEVRCDAVIVGVAGQPNRGLQTVVDENRSSLAPPPELREDVRRVREDFKMRGLCEEEAHNSAWVEVGFEDRYLNHLEENEAARRDQNRIEQWIRDGKAVVLVCFEGDNRRSHRRLLLRRLLRRINGPD